MNIFIYPVAVRNQHTIYKINMDTKNGLQVTLLSLGASIQKITFCMPSGKARILNMSFHDLSAYEKVQEYAGMTIGPNAGRIEDTTLKIDNHFLNLAHNEGNYSLHGGFDNISLKNWHIIKSEQFVSSCSVTLETTQADGVDGFPGNRHYQVTYTLTSENCLMIHYLVTTDRNTYINLTNHTYWNLTGNPETALTQTLTLPAELVCVNSDDHLPLCLKSVTDSNFDFRKEKFLFKGLNHGFVFNNDEHSWHSCKLRAPKEHISLTVSTDAPGIVVYSGDYIEPGTPFANGKISASCCGIALEAQELPTVSSYHITTPENAYQRNIQFQIQTAE